MLRCISVRSNLANRMDKAKKFGSVGDEDDDELEEEGLLETPLDKVEPYGLFKETLMSTPAPLIAPHTASRIHYEQAS